MIRIYFFTSLLLVFFTTNLVKANDLSSRSAATLLGKESLNFSTQNSYYKYQGKVSNIYRWVMVKIQRAQSVEQILVPVKNGQFSADIYLRSGPGEYQVLLYATESYEKYTTYKFQNKGRILNSDKRNLAYLLPSQYVQSNDPLIIKRAKEITKNAKNEVESVKLINDWVIKNITYDFASIDDLSYLDTPSDASYVLKNKTGVCLAFANINAALVRALGIRVKVIKGQTDIHGVWTPHAWNEVFVDKKWQVVDPTWNATYAVKNLYVFPNAKFFNATHRKIKDYEHY